MLPNLRFPVLFFSQPIILKTITKYTQDFIEYIQVLEEKIIQATVQPAEKENLKIEQIDYSLIYLEIHSTTNMEINQFVEYKDKNYRIIAKGLYNDYGYNNVIAEESKLILKKYV